MKFYVKVLFVLILTIPFTQVRGQEKVTLEGQTLEEINALYNKHIDVRDTIAVEYAKALVKKAQEENHLPYLFRAYYSCAYSIKKIKKDYALSIKYADSAIRVYKKGLCDEYLKLDINLADAYHTKGSTLLIHYHQPKEALELFLKGQEYLKVCPDKVTEESINNAISFIYTKIGEYEKALEMDQKNFLQKKSNPLNTQSEKENYLIRLEHLVVSYMNVKQYRKALELIKEGIQKSKELKMEMPFLYYAESECYYRLGDYSRTLKAMDTAWVYYKKNNRENKYEIYFMKGLLLDKLQEFQKSTYCLRRMDSLIFDQKDFSLQQAEGYKVLLAYYNTTQQYDSQLYYTDRYLYIDSVLDDRYKSFSGELKSRYEIPNLVEDREMLIQKLEKHKKRKQNYIYGLLLLGGFVSLWGLYFYQKQKKYKKAYQIFQSGSIKEQRDSFKEPSATSNLTLSQEVVDDLVEKLAIFEQEKQYLSSKMNLQRLAVMFKTNSLYISKVINHKKQKNFTSYINDLRIDESVKILQQETMYQHYTIKALAEEFGFSSTQSYSKAFYKRTGMYPSYFINQLKKEQRQEE